jgi:hypothetical protein
MVDVGLIFRIGQWQTAINRLNHAHIFDLCQHFKAVGRFFVQGQMGKGVVFVYRLFMMKSLSTCHF